MRRSTGERRRSSRIPPTRRNPSYAPSRPTHRGSAAENMDLILAEARRSARGGALLAEDSASPTVCSTFETPLGKRRTEFRVATKLPASSRVVSFDCICQRRPLPPRAAAMSKVEAARLGDDHSRVSRTDEPFDLRPVPNSSERVAACVRQSAGRPATSLD